MLRILTVVLSFWIVVCGRSPGQGPAAQPPSDAHVRALADIYLHAYLERYPERITLFGVAGLRQDRLRDNSLDALRAWHEKEDSLLAEAQQISPAGIDSHSLRATYAILREALEASIGARVCRTELWTVSEQSNGWQVRESYYTSLQPVGTDAARQDALTRWGSLPKYIDTEIANLRVGMKEGYTAPKRNVQLVIDQMDGLLSGPIKDSPYASPAARDTEPEFKKAFLALVNDRINPAFRKYRDFLAKEYLPVAREAPGVSANPNGSTCYEALVRFHSSLPVPAKQVHETGLQQTQKLDAEMQEIAERSFHTRDLPALLQRLRTDKKFTFKNRDELIAYSQAALARAKAGARDSFGRWAKADVVVQPVPAFREKNGVYEYLPSTEDGSRPGIFLIDAYQPQEHNWVEDEATVFHETIPGHHLQGAIALEHKEIHPIGRYIDNNGYVEGWALYAERLADELKLYSSDTARLGMLSSQALRAVRLVVDSGLHTMGWTRQRAIDYMLAHTTEDERDAASEIDRYIIDPGQATAYTLGMLEIRKARDDAQATMGRRFDIRAFHDRVLEDGGVPLTFLREKIASWAAGE
jgi:uncharacterized protein (DUF885 family)